MVDKNNGHVEIVFTLSQFYDRNTKKSAGFNRKAVSIQHRLFVCLCLKSASVLYCPIEIGLLLNFCALILLHNASSGVCFVFCVAPILHMKSYSNRDN